MALTEAEIVTIVTRELTQAQGYENDVLAAKRAEALNYYNGKMETPATGSSVVSTDVADAVHGLMAQLQPIIKTTMVEFAPLGLDDEQSAQMESDFVRDSIAQASGFTVLYGAIHDALLTANGWLYVGTSTEEEVDVTSYEPNLPDEAIAVLTQPTQPNQVVEWKDNGKTTDIRRTTTTKELVIETVPAEEMLFNEGLGISDIQKQRFVARAKIFSQSALRELGHSKAVVESCEDYTEPFTSQARQGQEYTGAQPIQEQEKLKRVYCCYIRMALSGDVSELREVWVSGQNLLFNEPAKYIPFITGSALPMPHRIQGQGMYDLLREVQNGKTHILRQYNNNLSVMNSSRIGAVEGQVNLEDLTNGEINGVVRIRNPNALVPIPSNDIGPQAISGLSYWDQVRTQRVGASLDLNELQAQLMSTSATAAAGTLGQVEKQAGWYAQNLVETMVKPLFVTVHRVLREEIAGPVSARLREQWIQTDTSQWPLRKRLNTVMGFTTSEKAQRINAMNAIIMQQKLIYEMGGQDILVDNTNVYNAMCDWCRANDLPEPDEYILNPTSQQSQQAAQQKLQAAQEQSQADWEKAKEMEVLKSELQRTVKADEITWKYYNTNATSDAKEAELVLSAMEATDKLERETLLDKNL